MKNQTENKTNEKLNQVMEQLEQGVKAVYTSGKYAEYLACMAKFRRYSVNNTILIYSQCPGASLVAGFRAWQEQHKRHVKKGEKAIYILAPSPRKMTVEAVDPETGEKYMKEVRWNTYKPVCVFDVSQTEGEPLPSIVDPLTGSMEHFDELFSRLEAVSPVPIGFEQIDGGANGYCHHVEHRIAIREGMSQEQTIKTAVHEIAHAILHNWEDGEEKDTARHVKEVQAESVAFVVCNALGLDTSCYSFGYIAGWAEGQDAKDLTANLDVIRKTANTLIEAITANEADATAPAGKAQKANAPEAPAQEAKEPKKSQKKTPKKSTKKAPEKPSATTKALEKWSISAGKRLDKLLGKVDARYANTPEGCYFLDYYNPYWLMFIPGYQVQTAGKADWTMDKLPQLCQMTENHKPVMEAVPGTWKSSAVTRYTNADGVQMWVNDKYRRYFPKAAHEYIDRRTGKLILTLGEGDEETIIGGICPINIPESGEGWKPLEEAKAA